MEVWKKVINLKDIAIGSKGCVKFGSLQIALVHYSKHEWYAVQNLCPHQQQNVLSRGLIGDRQGEPKLVCPLHKNAFSLKTGKHLEGNADMQLQTFPVKEEEGYLFIKVEEQFLTSLESPMLANCA